MLRTVKRYVQEVTIIGEEPHLESKAPLVLVSVFWNEGANSCSGEEEDLQCEEHENFKKPMDEDGAITRPHRSHQIFVVVSCKVKLLLLHVLDLPLIRQAFPNPLQIN